MASRQIIREAVTGPSLADCQNGPLGPYLSSDDLRLVNLDGSLIASGPAASGADLIFASYVLQKLGNYREVLSRWFGALAPHGRLAIIVPHAFLYERQDALPSRRDPDQHRLYTPRSLMEEVEEALEPNSYRVRWLGDDDRGYDYSLPSDCAPSGAHHVAVLLERIPLPSWTLGGPTAPSEASPTIPGRPDRTRMERLSRRDASRVLVLKLDHLGDFIMAVPALRRLRDGLPDAHITIAVGSWNRSLAEAMGLFDAVIDLDVYPRNSSEERVDVRGKAVLAEQLIYQDYDLAIDMRMDGDTRFLLQHVKASQRAGIGSKADFPFLDIFAPIDATRHHIEAALDIRCLPRDFSARADCTRSDHAICFRYDNASPHGGAIVFGPYRTLDRGDYIFEPFLETDPRRSGVLICDIAVEMESTGYIPVTENLPIKLPFKIEARHGNFEFRIHSLPGEAPPNFAFYGGRLIRRGGEGVLHHREYLELLVELILIRLRRTGTLGNAR